LIVTENWVRWSEYASPGRHSFALQKGVRSAAVAGLRETYLANGAYGRSQEGATGYGSAADHK
jgi:hypothetical protein